MTVHMFRCFIGKGPMSITDLESRIDQWVAEHTTWDGDSTPNTLTERNTRIDGSGATYYGVDVRFIQTDTKSNIQQKFTDKLVNKVDWYRVGYHACDHDESNGGPCSWNDNAEWSDTNVSIPTGVPEMNPSL